MNRKDLGVLDWYYQGSIDNSKVGLFCLALVKSTREHVGDTLSYVERRFGSGICIIVALVLHHKRELRARANMSDSTMYDVRKDSILSLLFCVLLSAKLFHF